MKETKVPDASLVRRTGFADPNEEFEYDWRLAKVAAASGLYPDARRAEQAMGKIMLGKSLGLDATQSLIGIYIVEGKPQVSAVTLGAFVRKIPDYDYRVVSHSDEECSIEFGRGTAPERDENGEWLPWAGSFGVSSFTIQDAEKAGLVKDKSGWKKYPRNMLFARAMSNGVKWFAPDATQGIPVYHEGEIESGRFVDGSISGEVSEGETTSLSEVMAEVPEDLRDRLYAAYGEAADLRPGQMTPAAIQMKVHKQSPETIGRYVAEVEAANAVARSRREQEAPPDAEIVSDEDLSGEEKTREGGSHRGCGDPHQSDPNLAAQNLADGPADPQPTRPPGEVAEVVGREHDPRDTEVLRARLSKLEEDLEGDRDLSAEQVELIEEEIGYVRSELEARGGDVPGQESLI